MSYAFHLVAGHPALDLVNTLDWRFREEGRGRAAEHLWRPFRFTEQSKMLTAGQVRRLRRSVSASNRRPGSRTCRELREALAEIFYRCGRSSSSTSRKTLERYFKAARQQQKLNWKQSPHLEWEWRRRKRRDPFPFGRWR